MFWVLVWFLSCRCRFFWFRVVDLAVGSAFEVMFSRYLLAEFYEPPGSAGTKKR